MMLLYLSVIIQCFDASRQEGRLAFKVPL